MLVTFQDLRKTFDTSSAVLRGNPCWDTPHPFWLFRAMGYRVVFRRGLLTIVRISRCRQYENEGGLLGDSYWDLALLERLVFKVYHELDGAKPPESLGRWRFDRVRRKLCTSV